MTDREQTRRDAERVVPKRSYDALLADLEQAERERDEAREDVARCAADTTAVELAQEVECLKAELRAQRGYKMDALARLAKVPALVEKAIREGDDGALTDDDIGMLRDELIAVWEQE